MGYIKEILEYFFKHETAYNIKSRVYKRLLSPRNDKERDEALKLLWDELDSDASADWKEAYDNVEAVIHKNVNRKIHIHYFKKWYQIAAIWVFPFIMLCASGYFYMNSIIQKESSNLEVSYVQYYAKAGSREKVNLPDGSSVWLNSGSTLIYPSTFSSSKRGVYLMGEGFFDVAKDPEHPFVVNTGSLKIQVLGTSFNVSAYPDDSQIKTTLESGLLKVVLQNDTTMSYYLEPNNQLVYTLPTNKVERFYVNASDFSDWRMGGLLLNNVSFVDAMKAIERMYDVKVHIRTSVYNNQKIYVHYNKNESLENVFHILKIMIPELEYMISGKSVYIE